MTALSGRIQLRGKTAAEWAAYATAPLDRQPCVETDTGQLKIGDGTTLYADLPYVGTTSGELTTMLISGGTISVVTDDVTVASATYSIEGEGTFTAPQTAFNNIALSASGNQRYVGFFGTTSNTITKVEGTESSVAAYPSTPANTCPIGYVLVTDAAYTPEEPEPVNFADIGGNASDNASLVSHSASRYAVSFGISAAITLSPADSTDYYFGIPYAAPITPLSATIFSRQLSVPQSGVIRSVALTIWVNSTIGSNENSTLTLEVYSNTAGLVSSNVISSTVKWNDVSRANNYLVTGLSIAVTAGQFILFKLTTPAWATNPTVTWLQGMAYITV